MPKGKAAHQPVTPERRRKFLEVLAEIGSPVEAARQATPWGTGRQAGYHTFRRLRERDPTFAEDWADALAVALARIEREIVNRAMNPPRRPVYESGKVVGWVEDRNSSDRLLLRVAQRLDPTWAERRHHDVQGEVRHEHNHRHSFRLRAEHVMLLDEPDRELLVGLLDNMYDRMEENHGRRALPAPAGA